MLAAIAIVHLLFAVKTVNTVTLHDGARNRDIPIKVYYPDSGTGPFPVIVFSHGYGGTKDGYEYLGRAWSEAGYVVIAPTHIGSDRSAVLRHGAALARDPDASYQLQLDRTADVGYILTSLGEEKNSGEIERQIRDLKGKLDRGHIGVGGHSMGAGTAMLLSGAAASVPGASGHVFRDSRVKAGIAMSPQGSGEEGFNEHSWDDISIPVMTMSGTKDYGIGGQSAEWRREAFAHLPAGDKYQVIVNGARHLSFATGNQYYSCIVAESLAFWDAYLKGQSAAKKKIADFEECQVSAK